MARDGIRIVGLTGCVLWLLCVSGHHLAEHPHPPGNALPDSASLLRFNTETGEFDSTLSEADIAGLMKLWKMARTTSPVLSPDEKHGARCGTHQFLQSRWLVQSPFLVHHAVFLVSPGKRPCDFDEPCRRARKHERTVCAHTQFMDRFPVAVDSSGTVQDGYVIDTSWFNSLTAQHHGVIADTADAKHLVHLCVFLMDRTTIIQESHAVTAKNHSDDFVVTLHFGQKRAQEFSTTPVWLFTVDRRGCITAVESDSSTMR